MLELIGIVGWWVGYAGDACGNLAIQFVEQNGAGAGLGAAGQEAYQQNFQFALSLISAPVHVVLGSSSYGDGPHVSSYSNAWRCCVNAESWTIGFTAAEFVSLCGLVGDLPAWLPPLPPFAESELWSARRRLRNYGHIVVCDHGKVAPAPQLVPMLSALLRPEQFVLTSLSWNGAPARRWRIAFGDTATVALAPAGDRFVLSRLAGPFAAADFLAAAWDLPPVAHCPPALLSEAAFAAAARSSGATHADLMRAGLLLARSGLPSLMARDLAMALQYPAATGCIQLFNGRLPEQLQHWALVLGGVERLWRLRSLPGATSPRLLEVAPLYSATLAESLGQPLELARAVGCFDAFERRSIRAFEHSN